MWKAPNEPAALGRARVQVNIVGTVQREHVEAAHVHGVGDAPKLFHIVVELRAPYDGVEPRHDHLPALNKCPSRGTSSATEQLTVFEFQKGLRVDL